MNIKIVCVGKIKEMYLKKLIENHMSAISKTHSICVFEVADEKTPDKASLTEERQIRDKEGDRILRHIDEHDYAIMLDMHGKALTSNEFKKHVMENTMNGKTIAFVIGGSLGLGTKVLQRANLKLSFGQMTFPHQLMRVILLDELCRCYL